MRPRWRTRSRCARRASSGGSGWPEVRRSPSTSTSTTRRSRCRVPRCSARTDLPLGRPALGQAPGSPTVLPRFFLGRRLAAALCAAVVGVSVLAACSGGSKHAAAPTPSATPPPTPKPTPRALLATLNGLPPASGPVVVFKIDNSTSARPLQKGFARAPVVYQEIIEGQATRFAAVFVGKGSPEVGPIRSARDTDIELLAQYGPVIMGFSGANVHVLAHVDASPLVGIPQERYGSAYT